MSVASHHVTGSKCTILINACEATLLNTKPYWSTTGENEIGYMHIGITLFAALPSREQAKGGIRPSSLNHNSESLSDYNRERPAAMSAHACVSNFTNCSPFNQYILSS